MQQHEDKLVHDICMHVFAAATCYAQLVEFQFHVASQDGIPMNGIVGICHCLVDIGGGVVGTGWCCWKVGMGSILGVFQQNSRQSEKLQAHSTKSHLFHTQTKHVFSKTNGETFSSKVVNT